MTGPQITPGAKPSIEALRRGFQEAAQQVLGGRQYQHTEPGARRQGGFSELAARLGAGIQSLGQRLVMVVAPNSARANPICAQAFQKTHHWAGQLIKELKGFGDSQTTEGTKPAKITATQVQQVRSTLAGLVESMGPLLARGSTPKEVLLASLGLQIQGKTSEELNDLLGKLTALASEPFTGAEKALLGSLVNAVEGEAESCMRDEAAGEALKSVNDLGELITILVGARPPAGLGAAAGDSYQRLIDQALADCSPQELSRMAAICLSDDAQLLAEQVLAKASEAVQAGGDPRDRLKADQMRAVAAALSGLRERLISSLPAKELPVPAPASLARAAPQEGTERSLGAAGKAALASAFDVEISETGEFEVFRELSPECQAYFLKNLHLTKSQIASGHEDFQRYSYVDSATGQTLTSISSDLGWRDFKRNGPTSHLIVKPNGEIVPLRPPITEKLASDTGAVTTMILQGINAHLIPTFGDEQTYQVSCYANQDLSAGIEGLGYEKFTPYQLPDKTKGRLPPTSSQSLFKLRADSEGGAFINFDYSAQYNTLQVLNPASGKTIDHPVKEGRSRVTGEVRIDKSGSLKVTQPLKLAARIEPDSSRLIRTY